MTQSVRDTELQDRLNSAKTICRKAGILGLDHFKNQDLLTIDYKGPQDIVTQADGELELFIRKEIISSFPNDGIIGEELDSRSSSGSPFTWVVDPIDGTANFARGIPIWAVVLACLYKNTIILGIVYDPVHDELFSAFRGGGAWLDNRRISVDLQASIDRGLIGVGSSASRKNNISGLVDEIVSSGGVFVRTGSGALGIANVACGRYIAYLEQYMNAWDCMASLLLVKEAGGLINNFDIANLLACGGPVLAASPSVSSDINTFARNHFIQIDDNMLIL